MAASKAINVQPESVPDRIKTPDTPVFMPSASDKVESLERRYKRRGLIPITLILICALAITAFYLMVLRQDDRNLSTPASPTLITINPSRTSAGFIHSAEPEITERTNTALPFTKSPIPESVISDPLNLSDPESVVTWVRYAIENENPVLFDQFIHTNEIIYVNYIEGGQMISVSNYINDLKERTSSKPVCLGTYLDEYYLQIWYSKWKPAWEMTELCYDGCSQLDPPWNSTTAAFFFEKDGSNYKLTKMYLNEPYKYFFQDNIPLTACDVGKSSIATVTPISSCPGSPPQRLRVGERGKVCTRADPVKLRTNPGRTSPVITKLPTGTLFNVIGGPECGGDNWSWWQIQTDNGQTGWIAEGGDDIDPYFLCPLP